MSAPRFEGNGRITWHEQDVADPGPGELLIQVAANSLCGSDRHQFYQGSRVIPGHEASGTVVAAGLGTTVQSGTPGVIFLMDFCGQCRNCLAGRTNLCQAKRADMGFTHNGGYGRYMLVHENIFFPVDSDLPLVEATMLLDIMGTGGHAISRGMQVHSDIQSVAISGAGPIGLGVLAMIRTELDADLPVFITDIVPYRLELAERLGAMPVNLKERTLEAAIREHGLASIDMAIDTSGKTIARQASLAVLARPDVLVCVGHGEELNLNVSQDLISPEHSILGSEYFTFGELSDNLPRLRENLDYFSQIITHRFAIEDVQRAYELFFSGDSGKVVVHHGD